MKNLKVFLLSILGIIFLILAFLWSFWFVAGAVVIVIINQRELMKKPSKKK
jgi:hypothetical protein